MISVSRCPKEKQEEAVLIEVCRLLLIRHSNEYSQLYRRHSILKNQIFMASHLYLNFEQTLVQVNGDCIHRTAVLLSMSLNK